MKEGAGEEGKREREREEGGERVETLRQWLKAVSYNSDKSEGTSQATRWLRGCGYKQTNDTVGRERERGRERGCEAARLDPTN